MEKLRTIYGDKAILRPITAEDTPLIVKWRNNPAVQHNFVFQQTFTNEMHNKWLETKVKTGEVVQYIIVDKAADTPVGSVYFRDIDNDNHSAEFGIFIGEDIARGKGIGSETTRLFCDMGFEDLALHRIMLRVFSDNEQAKKSYLNAGFVLEGEFKDMVMQNGAYRSMTFMAKIAPKQHD